MAKYLTAKEARDLSKKTDKANLTILMQVIQKHAEVGDRSCTVSSDLVPCDSVEVVRLLESYGYKAKFVVDFRDGNYFDVRW